MRTGFARKVGKRLDYAWAGFLAFVLGPALLVGVPYYYIGVVGNPSGQNIEMFLGLVGALLGVLCIGLGGLRFHSLHAKRKRFDALLSGERRSEVARSWEELERLARELPPRYRTRLNEARQEVRRRR